MDRMIHGDERGCTRTSGIDKYNGKIVFVSFCVLCADLEIVGCYLRLV